jgi:hypothetical protein
MLSRTRPEAATGLSVHHPMRDALGCGMQPLPGRQ